MTGLKENEMKEYTNKEEWFSDKDDEKGILSDNTILKAKAEVLKYLHQTNNKETLCPENIHHFQHDEAKSQFV